MDRAADARRGAAGPMDRGMGPGNRGAEEFTRYAPAPGSDPDLQDPERGFPMGAPHNDASTRRAPPPSGNGARRKDVTMRYTVVAVSTLFGLFLLFSTGEYKILLMNISFLPLLAVLLNVFVMSTLGGRMHQDDIVSNTPLSELLAEVQVGVGLLKSTFGQLQGKDLRQEASIMVKQAVVDFGGQMMDRVTKELSGVMAKQSVKLEEAVASKAAGILQMQATAFENGHGKKMLDALQALQSAIDGKDKEMQAFEQRINASQHKILEALAKGSNAELLDQPTQPASAAKGSYVDSLLAKGSYRTKDLDGAEGTVNGFLNAKGEVHGVGQLAYDDGRRFVGTYLDGAMVEGVVFAAPAEDSAPSNTAERTMKTGTWTKVVDSTIVAQFADADVDKDAMTAQRSSLETAEDVMGILLKNSE